MIRSMGTLVVAVARRVATRRASDAVVITIIGGSSAGSHHSRLIVRRSCAPHVRIIVTSAFSTRLIARRGINDRIPGNFLVLAASDVRESALAESVTIRVSAKSRTARAQFWVVVDQGELHPFDMAVQIRLGMPLCQCSGF
jgi:hypothetical protein